MERAPEPELEQSVFESQAPELEHSVFESQAPELEPSQNPAGSEALISSIQKFNSKRNFFTGGLELERRLKISFVTPLESTTWPYYYPVRIEKYANTRPTRPFVNGR